MTYSHFEMESYCISIQIQARTNFFVIFVVLYLMVEILNTSLFRNLFLGLCTEYMFAYTYLIVKAGYSLFVIRQFFEKMHY